MQLDDLDAVEVGSTELGASHHQRRSDREVRGDDSVGGTPRTEQLGTGFEIAVGEAGRTDDSVHRVLGTPAEVLASR